MINETTNLACNSNLEYLKYAEQTAETSTHASLFEHFAFGRVFRILVLFDGATRYDPAVLVFAARYKQHLILGLVAHTNTSGSLFKAFVIVQLGHSCWLFF